MGSYGTLGAKQSSRSVALTPESINEAQWSPRESPGRLEPVVLKAKSCSTEQAFLRA